MTQHPTDDLAKAARDSLHVAVGLGLMAFQRAQVRRQELRKQMNASPLADARREVSKAVGDNLKLVEERLQDAEERLDAALDDVQERLPEPVRDAMGVSRSAAKEARKAVRAALDGVPRPR